MDLHQKEIQGFYEIPVDNLRASPFLISYIQDRVSFTVVFRVHLVYTFFTTYFYNLNKFVRFINFKTPIGNYKMIF